MTTPIDWLLASDEPWTRFRAMRDILGLPEADPQVQAARRAMLDHSKVQSLISAVASWGERPLKRHNDASHPLYALSTLADFGLRRDDPGISEVVEKILEHQSPEGAFQTLVFIPSAFGGPDHDLWSWIACDAPTLLYVLLAFGLGEDENVERAATHLAEQAIENGYRCSAAPELGRFRGPGRRADPCPIANLYALKAFSLSIRYSDSPAARLAAEMLLSHWEHQKAEKYYLFGVGTDFRKLKYPYVWYDILHVAEALSRFAFVNTDPRFLQILETITAQADGEGRHTAGSMYQSWKGWSFADKKVPSPWLTFLVWRILSRH